MFSRFLETFWSDTPSQFTVRPNKKNVTTWLASHSHKFSEAGGWVFF